MATVDLASYKNIYIKTAKEYVNSLLAGCDKLVSDSQNKDAINQIHISSHSLKSQSQVMGFADITSLCAVIEKTSNDILNGAKQVDDKFITFLKRSVDEITEMLKQVQHDTLRKTL